MVFLEKNFQMHERLDRGRNESPTSTLRVTSDKGHFRPKAQAPIWSKLDFQLDSSSYFLKTPFSKVQWVCLKACDQIQEFNIKKCDWHVRGLS